MTKSWDFISSRGVSDDFYKENKMTVLLNRASFLTSCAGLLTLITSFVFGADFYYKTMIVLIIVLHLLILVFHHYYLIRTAKIYLTTIACIWTYLTIVFFGGFFSQGISSMATITLAYILFRDEKTVQRRIIGYNVILYVLSTAYLAFFGPVLNLMDYPLDEIGVFLVSMGWIIVVFPIYENEKNELIVMLEKRNNSLRKTTEELERFTHIASHDLKSPLRNIISFLGLIERDVKRSSFENLQINLGYVKSSAFQLNALVEDIQKYSHLNIENSDEFILIDLNEIAQICVANLMDDIRRKNANIEVGNLPSVNAIKLEMVVLFQNIIQNGLKYNENESPELKIWGEKNKNQLLLFFQDNGIGIEEEYYEYIFAFFKRLHTTEKYQGSGLGLGLCKKIVHKLGGTISVQSEYGKGSVFQVTLPLSN